MELRDEYEDDLSESRVLRGVEVEDLGVEDKSSTLRVMVDEFLIRSDNE